MLPKDSGGYNSIIMLPKDSGGYNTLILTTMKMFFFFIEQLEQTSVRLQIE